MHRHEFEMRGMVLVFILTAEGMITTGMARSPEARGQDELALSLIVISRAPSEEGRRSRNRLGTSCLCWLPPLVASDFICFHAEGQVVYKPHGSGNPR